MIRTRAAHLVVAIAAGLLVGVTDHGSTRAQAPGQYGQRVGNSYLPSTHDAGCQGLVCSSLPIDPANPSRPLPPPPCQGLICGLTPYSMGRPYTASEAAAAERARAEAQAQAAAATPAPLEPITRPVRKPRKANRRVAKAPRTPAPTDAPEAAK